MSCITQILNPPPAPPRIDPVCKLELRNVYGAWKVYPFCDTAKGFAAIAGTSTLTGATLNQIARMGFHLQVLNGACLDVPAILLGMGVRL